jgi:drug/metabolite transporter (DMT)-like permease
MSSASGSGQDPAPTIPASHPALRAMPWAFVMIWSTGFVVARYAMPHAPPFGFLALRFFFSVLAFALWAAWARPAWPVGRGQWLHLAVTGVLMHVGYLGGVWVAVKHGLGAGLAALIVGMQPVLTALWISLSVRLKHRSTGIAVGVPARQWLGLLLGLTGLTLVVSGKLAWGEAQLFSMSAAVVALISITAGTLYQKRWVQACDVRSANLVQLAAALLVTLPLLAFEQEAIDWHPDMLGALAWSVLVLTLGGSSLLYMLIQRGAATSVSSLMYLVPPCAAVLAALLFDEALTPLVLVGFFVAALGVAVTVRSPVVATRANVDLSRG